MPNASAAVRITHASAAQLREVVADAAPLDRTGSRSRPRP